MTTKTSWKKRIGTILVGHIANVIIVQFFDSVLYPFVVGKYGLIVGGSIMIWASLLICLLTLKFYDWSGKDWLGIETLKEAREMENSRVNKFIAKFLRKSAMCQLVILSIIEDPFIVVVFLREGAHRYGSMTKKDWQNFFASLFIANGFWVFTCWTGIKILEKLGASIEVASAILSGVFISIFLVGFIIGKMSEKREVKASLAS